MIASEIGLEVYRRRRRDSAKAPFKDAGFSLAAGPVDKLTEWEPVGQLKDSENGVVVYLFNSEEACRALIRGMEIGGIDPVMSAIGTTNLGCPGVIREIDNYEEYQELLWDRPDGSVVVIDCRDSEEDREEPS